MPHKSSAKCDIRFRNAKKARITSVALPTALQEGQSCKSEPSDRFSMSLAHPLLCGNQTEIHTDTSIMDKFAPEFAQHWLTDRSSTTDARAVERRADESPSASQQEALDALAERVSAARSVF
jgi:hypothetical protein